MGEEQRPVVQQAIAQGDNQVAVFVALLQREEDKQTNEKARDPFVNNVQCTR
ncbi:MAG: hypothetical protein V4669_21260 [Pseudomonadota bacterium]